MNQAGSLPHNVEIPVLKSEEDFPAYWETFENLVHQNTKVSVYWKYQYLRQGMKGEAADLLKSLSPLTENYETPRQLVIERFGQPRRIVRGAEKAIRDVMPATSDPKSLRKTYETLFTSTRL